MLNILFFFFIKLHRINIKMRAYFDYDIKGCTTDIAGKESHQCAVRNIRFNSETSQARKIIQYKVSKLLFSVHLDSSAIIVFMPFSSNNDISSSAQSQSVIITSKTSASQTLMKESVPIFELGSNRHLFLLFFRTVR